MILQDVIEHILLFLKIHNHFLRETINQKKKTTDDASAVRINLCNVCTDQVDPITMEPLVEPTIRIDAGDGFQRRLF